jgi:hypothetical protein
MACDMNPTTLGLPTAACVTDISVALHAQTMQVSDTLQSTGKSVNVLKAIDLCANERQQKIIQLKPDVQKSISDLERDLNELNASVLEFYKARDKYHQLLDDPSGEQDIQLAKKDALAKKKKMEECFPRLFEQHKACFPPSTSYPFMQWEQLERFTLSEAELTGNVNFFKEQLLNAVVNRNLHVKNIKATFDQHMKAIAATFFQGTPFNRVEPFPQRGETHNGGKIATRVVCYNNDGQKIGTLFYKPRDATIDEAVVQLFRDINNLPQDEQNPRPSLPEYKIMNFPSHDRSIWEYIEGEPLDVDVHYLVEAGIEERVRVSVEHLESVCRALGVSDLHHDNLIKRRTATSPTSFQNEIVPIDLESIQSGKDTGMFDLSFPPPRLTDQELSLIKQCSKRLKDIRVRYVPVGTGDFEGALSDYRYCKVLANSIIQQMKDDGYRPIETKDSLTGMEEHIEFLILQDLVRGDIPYCVMHGEMIYWEPQHELIAKKR